MIKVIVIGEICIDQFVYCKAERLSPEAPVPVLQPIRTTANPGMAGNVSENVKALCTDQKLNLQTWTQTASIVKTRYVDEKSNHMFIRVDSGDAEVDSLELTESNKVDLRDADIVVVSDYNKGFLSLDQLEEIGKLSKLSILDSKRRLSEQVINAFTFVKLNSIEAQNNAHLLGTGNVIVTMGRDGCMFNEVVYTSPKPQETIDVSGAGDTFTASFILKYYKTQKAHVSIKYANTVAASVVSRRGITVPIKNLTI